MRRCFSLLQFACAALLLPCSIQAVPPVQFSAATNYTVADGPRAIACADFNHDGRPDLVTANQSGNSASVLLGLGGGVFQSPTNFSVGANPVFVAIGDFNTNGQWDVVTASYSSGSVSLLSGNGDGKFSSPTNWSVGDRPASVAVGDFNLDHNPDLAVVNTVVGTARVLLGKGNGTFVSGTINPVPGGSLHSIIADDFNGDGKPDLVTASGGSGDVGVLLGNGDGTFGTVSNYHATYVSFLAGNLQSAACGDFNNDGILDLVTVNFVDKSSTFLRGQGNGTFLVLATNDVGFSPLSVAVGDFNGDGNLDFVTANDSASSLSLRLGNGNGTFMTNIFLNVGTSQRHVAVADVNEDGKPDILTINGSVNTVSVLLNQSIPTLKIAPADNTIRISWPAWVGYQLESSTNLTCSWSPVANMPAAPNGQIIFTNPIAEDQLFYRLKHL